MTPRCSKCPHIRPPVPFTGPRPLPSRLHRGKLESSILFLGRHAVGAFYYIKKNGVGLPKDKESRSVVVMAIGWAILSGEVAERIASLRKK